MKEVKEPVEIRYNKELAVVQANELVRSKQSDLSLLEAKLIRLAISQIFKNQDRFLTYQCNITDLAEYLNLDKSNTYKEVKNLSESIITKSVFIADKENKKGKYHIFNWISSIKYDDGVITFRLNDELEPYLIGLQELFTSYQYDIIIKLPTSNSIRLFELLSSFQNIKYKRIIDHTFTEEPLEANEFLFTIEWLRDYFNCTDKYKNNADFIKRVITPSIEAIHKNSLMRIQYRYITKKRNIQAIVFKLVSWLHTDEADEIIQSMVEEAKKDDNTKRGRRYIVNYEVDKK